MKKKYLNSDNYKDSSDFTRNIIINSNKHRHVDASRHAKAYRKYRHNVNINISDNNNNKRFWFVCSNFQRFVLFLSIVLFLIIFGIFISFCTNNSTEKLKQENSALQNTIEDLDYNIAEKQDEIDKNY